MITAGAEIDACDEEGRSISEAVCTVGFEGIWISVLAECGYDSEPFIRDLDSYYHGKNPGVGVFTSIPLVVRSSRLSFVEYGKQRKSFGFCNTDANRNDYSEEWYHRQIEWEDFLKLVEKESDGEDETVFFEETDLYGTDHGS
jgi:hypothetical protein